MYVIYIFESRNNIQNRNSNPIRLRLIPDVYKKFIKKKKISFYKDRYISKNSEQQLLTEDTMLLHVISENLALHVPCIKMDCVKGQLKGILF